MCYNSEVYSGMEWRQQQYSDKRKIPDWAKQILQLDINISKQFVLVIKETLPYKITKYYKPLQLSCNGIAWLSFWIAFTWIFNQRNLAEIQVNILFGLFLDIIIVAISKAYFRRRRPTDSNDKTSFPSGYASRATFVFLFFHYLYPVDALLNLILFIWAMLVCLSSVSSQKHYILDVLAGILLGFIESVFIYIFGLSENTSSWLLSIVNDDKAIVDI